MLCLLTSLWAILAQVVEGLAIKEGDLLEFELTQERALRVTVMKSSTVTRKPKKLAVPELQASMAKKKTYRGGMHPGMMIPGQEAVAMSDLLLPAAAAAAAQGLPIRLPDVNATQVHHSCAHHCFPMLHKQCKSCQNMSAEQKKKKQNFTSFGQPTSSHHVLMCYCHIMSYYVIFNQHSSIFQIHFTCVSVLCCLFACAFYISSMSCFLHPV